MVHNSAAKIKPSLPTDDDNFSKENASIHIILLDRKKILCNWQQTRRLTGIVSGP